MADEQDFNSYSISVTFTGTENLIGSTNEGVPSTGGRFDVSGLVHKRAAGYFYADNRVGIGTVTPTAMLDIVGGITVQQSADLKWQNTARSSTYGVINSSASALTLSWSGVEAMRIDSSRNIGIGAISPGDYWPQANGLVVSRGGNSGITIAAASNCRLAFTAGSGATAGLTSGGLISYSHSSNEMTFGADGATRATVSSGGLKIHSGSFAHASGSVSLETPSYKWTISNLSGAWFPTADGAQPIGGGSNRVSVVYATTGTINTSDEREKAWLQTGIIGSDDNRISSKIDDEAFYRAGVEILDELGFYQWLDAIEGKETDTGPDGARLHFGARAQRVFACLEKYGIDPARIAFCCYDEWADEFEPVFETRTVKKRELRPNPKFNPDKKETARNKRETMQTVEVEEQFDTGETKLVLEAGDRYGLRLDMLNAFLGSVRDRRQDDLDARIKVLEQ